MSLRHNRPEGDPEEGHALLPADSDCTTSSQSSLSADDVPKRRVGDYEKALSLCGYGSFHWKLLFVCGWANASDAIEVLCVAFLMPSAQCDLKLTSGDKGWLSAIMFVGMMVGGYVWGALGDVCGRKSMLVSSLFFNALFSSASGLAQGKGVFLFLRFFSGLGVGGSIPLVWSYFAEFQPKDRRGRLLSALATFWMVGNIAVAGLAWVVIPNDMRFTSGGFVFNSWRLFVVLCGLPALVVAIFLKHFPESPKFLISRGEHAKAISVLSRVYSENTSKPESSFPLTSVIESPDAERRFSDHPNRSSWKRGISNFFSGVRELVTQSARIRRNLFILIFISFAIQLGYYGLWLWFPELFTKLEAYYKAHPNETVSVCEVTNFKQNQGEGADYDPFCANKEVPSEVFVNSFIVSLSSLPGNVWTILMMDRLGRKFFLVTSMILSGCSAFLIYFVTSSAWNLVVSCVFGAVSTMGFSALDCLGIELFPTHLRSTALAITLLFARVGAIIGNITFGYLIETSCDIPILLVAILLTLGGLASLALPNTTGVDIA